MMQMLPRVLIVCSLNWLMPKLKLALCALSWLMSQIPVNKLNCWVTRHKLRVPQQNVVVRVPQQSWKHWKKLSLPRELVSVLNT